MSSIIVLDSSDEDESPPKKINKRPTSEVGNVSTGTNASLLKNHHAKQRSIPSGLTITPRLSPTTMGATKGGSSGIGVGSMQPSPFQNFNNIISNERLTPTPPKGQVGSSNSRKRKTPTPPQPQLQTMPRLTAKNFATMTTSSPAKAATTLAPLPPIMPMITGVHSMAAGATPPLQLMATPPHNMAGYMGLNEQLMINPHLLPSSLPPNTTITAHTQNLNQNNINNNFKIHLPFNKPNTTPSPAASPASSLPKTPSPQLAPSPQPTRAEKNAKRIKPTTLLKSSDESWQRHKQISQKQPTNLNSDVVIEMLPPAATESPKSTSASSSRHHTPMTSPTTPKSQKSPDVIMLTPTDQSPSTHRRNETVLDLTHSPEKLARARSTTPTTKITEVVDLVNTPEQKKQHVNGIDAVSSKQNKNLSLSKNTNDKTEKPPPPPPRPPLEPEYEELIKACRQADPSSDMEKLIKSKLVKYYYEVHSDFVKSKSFRKSIRKVVDSIKAKPDLVYYNLKTVVEELKVRRKARRVEEAASGTEIKNNMGETNKNHEVPITDKVKVEDVKPANTTNSSSSTPATTTSTSNAVGSEISATATTSTGNKKLDEQIKKLNKALYVLTKRIEVLEQSEVDWDDDDSSFLQVERFKKRACQIYEKICDLTGESKNAHRLVKKPIKFNETRIPQFNKTLQAFINRTKEFPDYFDVLRMLEHCNRTYSLGLVNFEIKNIAEDAFIKVGKLLQARRKADLYETVTHYAGDGLDPAKTDPALAAKLNENLKNHKKISDILEKFARRQDMPEEEEEEDKADETANSVEGEGKSSSLNTEIDDKKIKQTISKNNEDKDEKEIFVKSEENKQETDETKKVTLNDDTAEDDDDEDDEDDDDEEDDDNLDEQVETLANTEVLDIESDTEIVSPTVIEIEEEVIQQEGSEKSLLNKDNATLGGMVVSKDFSMNKKLVSDTREITKENCMEVDNKTIMKINSESNDSTHVSHNNFDKSTTATTKTVIKTTSPNIIDKDKSLTASVSSSPTPLSPLVAIPNGKLKDILPTHQLPNSSNSSSDSSPTVVNIINNASVTATTTTTADLKIVHVSSLEPDSNILMNESHASLNRRNEDVINLCAELTTAPPASKSEEIVISDEES